MSKNLFFFLFFLISFFLQAQDQKAIDAMRMEIKKNIPDSDKLKLMHDVSWSTFRALPEKSLEIAKEALVLAKKSGLYKKESKSYNIVGTIFTFMGKYDSSNLYYNKSLNLGIEKKDRLIIAKGYGNLGLICFYQGSFDKSLEYYFKALKITEEIKDSVAMANTYANVANSYTQINSFKLAIEYLNKAFSLFEKMNNKQGMSNTLNTMGAVYADVDSLRSKAADIYSRSYKLKEELNDKFGMGNILHQLGILALSENATNKSLEYNLKALKIRRELDDSYGICTSLINIGNLYCSLKKPSEAFEYYNEGLSLSAKTQNKDHKKDVYYGLSNAYSLVKNFEEALHYRKLFSQVSDSILNEKKSEQIVEMQTKYETEKKEKQNALLIDENKIKTLELVQKEQQRKILIGSFALILLLGAIVYNYYRLKNKNKILQERALRAAAVFQAHEEEKIRISKDLHDGVGPLLSLIKLNISSIETNSSNEKIISKTKELAGQSIKEVRNISHSLMPGLLSKSGLKDALGELIEQINAEKLQVDFDYKISSLLKPEAELNIYRIIQEAINNILKHSGASKAKIYLEEKNQNLQIEINDNGSGFDKNKLTSSSGNGLNNIYSRVDFMKGKINMNSSSAGTNFTIQLPLDEISNG